MNCTAAKIFKIISHGSLALLSKVVLSFSINIQTSGYRNLAVFKLIQNVWLETTDALVFTCITLKDCLFLYLRESQLNKPVVTSQIYATIMALKDLNLKLYRRDNKKMALDPPSFKFVEFEVVDLMVPNYQRPSQLETFTFLVKNRRKSNQLPSRF